MTESNPEPVENKAASHLRRLASAVFAFLTSVPVLTIFILVAVDLLLRQGNPADAMGFRSVDLWDMPPRIEQCIKQVPDVALLGSSLMLVLNQDEKGKHFYSGITAPYLQSQLSKASGHNIKMANLCSGLQMISEGYFIANAVTRGRDHPPVIIYGLCLRDFIHDQFAAEWECDCFHSVAPYVDINPYVLAFMSGDNARKELLLSHFWYLYRNRSDFQNIFVGITKDLLEYLPLDQSFYRLGRDHAWRPQPTGFLPETWVPRRQEQFTEEVFQQHPEFLIRFFRQMQISIYKQGRQSTRELQARYLDQTVKLCRDKGIKLVIVDMPVAPSVSELVPKGLNDAFRGYLHSLSDQYAVTFIDLFADKRFGEDAFKDGVHLNYAGAHTLVDAVVGELVSGHRSVLDAMAAHAERSK